MKTLLILFFAMVVTLATGEPTPVPEERVRNLVERIRAELPEGWSVSYDAQYAWLEVKRDIPTATVRTYINMPASPPGGEKPEQRVVRFSLRVSAKIEPAEYERLAAENARIRQEAYAIYDVLNHKRIDRKFDSFLPREEEDKKLVAKYKSLKASLHPLPDGYFQDLSLDWETNGPNSLSPRTRPVEDSVARELEKAWGVLRKLMTPYESKTPEKSIR